MIASEDNSQLRILLTELGLNEYEKSSYLMILENGTTVAKEISDYTKIPYAKVYQVLDSLIEKGLIYGDEGRPKKFNCKDPEVAFIELLDKVEQNWNKIHSKRIQLVKENVPYFRKVFEQNKIIIEEEQGVWTISGLSNILNRIDALTKKSQNEIVIISDKINPIITKILELVNLIDNKDKPKISIRTPNIEIFHDIAKNVEMINVVGEATLIFFDEFANLSVVLNGKNQSGKQDYLAVLTQIEEIVRSLLINQTIITGDV